MYVLVLAFTLMSSVSVLAIGEEETTNSVWSIVILVIVLFVFFFSLFEIFFSSRRRKGLAQDIRKVAEKEEMLEMELVKEKKIIEKMQDEMHYMEEFSVHYAHEDFEKLFLYIKHAKERGRKNIQIMKNLVDSGWTKHIVDIVLDEVDKLDRLDIYISKAVKAGMDREKIKDTLVSTGWKENIVDSHMKKFANAS